jgi:Zn-dependent protease with chaperone function
MLQKIAFALLLLFFPLSAPAAARSQSDTARAGQFEQYYGLLPDEEAQRRVGAIGSKLVAANGFSPDGFTFKVINSAEINALALPGGYIYVFKGLLDFMPTDDEVAAVLGHEIGHVTGNHIARREREQLWSMIIGAILGGPEAAIAANAALAALPAYSQRDEREADDRGFSYLLGANMSPYAMLVVMNKLHDSDEHPDININFAQHPDPAVRAQRIKKYIQQMKIAPAVLETNGAFEVRDGEWSMVVRAPGGGDKPLYRAWLLAGSLYAIAQAGPVDPDKFIVDERKGFAGIYYGDRLVYNVHWPDVAASGDTFAQEAARCVALLRSWALARGGEGLLWP